MTASTTRQPAAHGSADRSGIDPFAEHAQTATDALHANIGMLWDAIALLEGALAHDDLCQPSRGAQRIVRMATQRLREFDGIVSPLI